AIRREPYSKKSVSFQYGLVSPGQTTPLSGQGGGGRPGLIVRSEEDFGPGPAPVRGRRAFRRAEHGQGQSRRIAFRSLEAPEPRSVLFMQRSRRDLRMRERGDQVGRVFAAIAAVDMGRQLQDALIVAANRQGDLTAAGPDPPGPT